MRTILQSPATNVWVAVNNDARIAVINTRVNNALTWTGVATFQVSGIFFLMGSVSLDIYAQAKDEDFLYEISYQGQLMNAHAMIQGLGHFSFTSRFADFNANAEWPVNPDEKGSVTTFGVGGTAGAELSITFQQFSIGGINWWDYNTCGGINLQAFAGGAFGSLDPSILKRNKVHIFT